MLLGLGLRKTSAAKTTAMRDPMTITKLNTMIIVIIMLFFTILIVIIITTIIINILFFIISIGIITIVITMMPTHLHIGSIVDPVCAGGSQARSAEDEWRAKMGKVSDVPKLAP